MELLRIYFGFASDPRTPEGWLSWQHLVFSSVVTVLFLTLGIALGRVNAKKEREARLKTLKITAVTMDALEIFKIVIISWRCHDPWTFRSILPLFLCSIMLIALPIAAFSKKRLQQAALDFSFVFGVLCCVAGSFLAGNYFSNSPIFSFDPMVSVTTHGISGFAAVYIGAARLTEMKKSSVLIGAVILFCFLLAALLVDLWQKDLPYESNYMFLLEDSGTPFSICTAIVHGIRWLYTLFVAALYFVYYALFHAGYALWKHLKNT